MALSVPTDLIRSAYLGTPAGYLGSYQKTRLVNLARNWLLAIFAKAHIRVSDWVVSL